MITLPFTDRYDVDLDGTIYSRVYGTVRRLRPWLFNHGYKVIGVRAGGRNVRLLVHRVVAILYIGYPASPELEVRHKDRVPTNCHYSNLEWGTHADNMMDMSNHIASGALVVENENRPRGERHPRRLRPELTPRGAQCARAKLTEDQATSVFARHQRGEAPQLIANSLGVSRWAIRKILNGENWKHIERTDEHG